MLFGEEVDEGEGEFPPRVALVMGEEGGGAVEGEEGGGGGVMTEIRAVDL